MSLATDQRPESLSENRACLALAISRPAVRRDWRRPTYCGPPAPRQFSLVNAEQLRATRPNEVWTWDITKRGEYLSLYVVMDLYSRYTVAWMLSSKQNRTGSTTRG